jgi:fructokinase
LKFGSQEHHIMSSNQLNINKKRSKAAVCFGTGLVALDVIVNGNPNTIPQFKAGGSCGNVLSILSFLGWRSFPIARLSSKPSSQILIQDLINLNVNIDLITTTEDGSTPVIIHRILRDSNNQPKHKFEFRVPRNGAWFPGYKPVLSNKVEELVCFPETPKVFYLDRVSRANIDLAKYYRERGAVIFFEPTSMTEEKQFRECMAIADIVKFSNDRLPLYKETYPTRQARIEVETLGANGLLYRSFINKTDEWKFIKAVHIDAAVDTAGAGDWCSAGLIHALIEVSDANALNTITNTKLEEALIFGQFLSALNCNYYGARGLMYHLTFSQIKSIFQDYSERKTIELKKKGPGFEIGDATFDFSQLI